MVEKGIEITYEVKDGQPSKVEKYSNEKFNEVLSRFEQLRDMASKNLQSHKDKVVEFEGQLEFWEGEVNKIKQFIEENQFETVKEVEEIDVEKAKEEESKNP